MKNYPFKHHFLLSTKASFVIYVASYIIKSFVFFELSNPFQWIIDIPKYDIEARSGILCMYVCLHIVVFAFTESKLKPENDNG